MDVAERVLSVVVRALPVGRREWGQAMRAELAQVDPGPARVEFVLGCARAVVRQPGRIGYVLLVLAAMGAAVGRAGSLSSGQQRAGVVSLVAVLVVVSWWGRRPGLLGPVRNSPGDRTLRACGYVVVIGLTVGLLPALWKDPDGAGLAPVLTVVLATFLIGFLAVTAERSAAGARTLVVGAGVAVLAAVIWGAVVVSIRPIPTDRTSAVVAVGLGMVLAALYGTGGRILNSLLAGVVGALSIAVLVVLLSSFGPPSLIPDLVGSVALTPADALEQSRAEIQDPYVVVAFGGFLLAALLAVVAVASRTRVVPESMTFAFPERCR